MPFRRLFFALVAALALAPTAGAHITLNPTQAAAESFARFAVRVPNERPDADTVEVTMQLPDGLFFVSFQPKPGWERTVEMEKLAQPVEIFGEQITERVASVTWTGGRIRPGEFDEFGLSARMPETAGQELAFPAIQRYSSGEVVRWIGPPDADEPAPRIALGAAEEEGQPAGVPAEGSEAGPGSDEDDGTQSAVALGLGAAGLAAGLSALGLALVRRPHRRREGGAV